MKIEDVIKEVKAIQDTMGTLIAGPSAHVLSSVVADLERQRERHSRLPRKAARPPWTLTIAPESPLAFQSTRGESEIKHELEIDLSCELSEPDELGTPRGTHNIAVRVWATKSDLCFRDEVDAECLRAPVQAQGRRVMLRFHFDLANSSQPGPKHHMQIGGKSRADEYGWLPDNWKLPRFVHFPMNLALACEFIGMTFYPRRFLAKSSEPTWTHAVRTAEQSYVFPFLQRLPYVKLTPKQHTASLLTSVWND